MIWCVFIMLPDCANLCLLCVLYGMMILCCFSVYALFFRFQTSPTSFVRIKFNLCVMKSRTPFSLPVGSARLDSTRPYILHACICCASSSIVVYLHFCIRKHCKEVLMTWFISNNLLLFCWPRGGCQMPVWACISICKYRAMVKFLCFFFGSFELLDFLGTISMGRKYVRMNFAQMDRFGIFCFYLAPLAL